MLNVDLSTSTNEQADLLTPAALNAFLGETNETSLDGLQIPLFGDQDVASVISNLSNHNSRSVGRDISSPNQPLFPSSLNSPVGYDMNASPLFFDPQMFPTLDQDLLHNNMLPTAPNTTSSTAPNTTTLSSLPNPRHSRLPSLVVSPVVGVNDGPAAAASDAGSMWIHGKPVGGPTCTNSRHFLSPNYLEGQDGHVKENECISGMISPPTGSVHRNDDGSWIANASGGAGGLSPHDRRNIGHLCVPNLNEQERMRDWEAKKTNVELWLSSSTPGSDAGDPNEPEVRARRRLIGRRRAKSTNDASSSNGNLFSPLAAQSTAVAVPGPGIYLDVASDNEDEDEEDLDILFVENIFDEDHLDSTLLVPDDDFGRQESPPADISKLAIHDDPSREDFDQIDPLSQPHPRSVSPWADPLVSPYPSTERYHPLTANAAILRFQRRAQDIESASLAATIGSRRLSDSDFNPSGGFAGFSWRNKERWESRTKFFGSILTKRASIGASTLLKRKNSHSSSHAPSPNPSSNTSPFISREDEKISTSQRLSNWARSKSPISFTREGTNEDSSGNTLTASWKQAKAVIATRRSRSKSDLVKPTEKVANLGSDLPPSSDLHPFLSELGGGIRKTISSFTRPKTPAGRRELESEGKQSDSPGKAIVMELLVSSDPVEPTLSGFHSQVRKLNPRLPAELIERFSQEQMRRYTRLAQMKIDHLKAVQNGTCPNSKHCLALGGQPQLITPRPGPRDGDAPFMGFLIPHPEIPVEDFEAMLSGSNSDGPLVAAQFPCGVPLPPVSRLPAELECPFCFEVRIFSKPSDWTKHILEDVQPFTCTFPNCTESKSFKRKADWVRHENERHRQLENWACDLPDCIHTCYRKENFAQHLVREHKLQETRSRARDGRRGVQDGNSDIWVIVDRCRHEDSAKLPTGEPCRFCGNICDSWKKLMVHLGKHMEQISMPVVPALERAHLTANSILAPVAASGTTTTTAGRPKAHSTTSATARPPYRNRRQMNQQPQQFSSPALPRTGAVAAKSSVHSASLPLPNQAFPTMNVLGIQAAGSPMSCPDLMGGVTTSVPVGIGNTYPTTTDATTMSDQTRLFAQSDQATARSSMDYFSQSVFSSGTAESPMNMQRGAISNHSLNPSGLNKHSYPAAVTNDAGPLNAFQSHNGVDVFSATEKEAPFLNHQQHRLSPSISPDMDFNAGNNAMVAPLTPFSFPHTTSPSGLGIHQQQNRPHQTRKDAQAMLTSSSPQVGIHTNSSSADIPVDNGLFNTPLSQADLFSLSQSLSVNSAVQLTSSSVPSARQPALDHLHSRYPSLSTSNSNSHFQPRLLVTRPTIDLSQDDFSAVGMMSQAACAPVEMSSTFGTVPSSSFPLSMVEPDAITFPSHLNNSTALTAAVGCNLGMLSSREQVLLMASLTESNNVSQPGTSSNC